MVTFGDIAEHSNSLLNKGFVHDKPWRVDLGHKIKNPVFADSASLSQDGKIAVSQSTTVKFPNGASLKGSIALDGTVTIEGCHTLMIQPALSVIGKVSGKLNTSKSSVTADIVGDLKRGPLHVRLNGSPLTRNWRLSTCAQVRLEQLKCNSPDTVTLGYEVSGNSTLESLQNSVGIAITRPINDHLVYGALRATPHNKIPFGKVALAIGGKTPSSVGSEMGGEAVYIVPEERTEMAFGAKWFADPETKKTMVKAKVDHEGKVAAAINHKVNDSLSITFGVQFDAARKAAASPKSQGSAGIFGVAINLSA